MKYAKTEQKEINALARQFKAVNQKKRTFKIQKPSKQAKLF